MINQLIKLANYGKFECFRNQPHETSSVVIA